MKRTFTLVFSLLAFGQMMAQKPLQLAPPQTASTRLFAEPGQRVAFDFRLSGAHIRYTTDGSEPQESSPIYTKPIKARATCSPPPSPSPASSAIYPKPIKVKCLSKIKAKSYFPGFVPSATTTVQLIQPGNVRIDSIAIVPAAKKYKAKGWNSLCDGILGDGSYDEHWLGFEEKEVEIKLFFAKKRKVSQLSIGYLRQQGAWIFGPAAGVVLDENGKPIGGFMLKEAGLNQPDTQAFFTLPLPKKRYKTLTIKLTGLPAIPDWHPGKGGIGWIFLDEIVLEK